MKKFTIILVGLVTTLLVVGVAVLWPRECTTSIRLSGTAGTPFTGFYMQDGHRVAVSATLPWAFQGVGITQFEFQKTNPTDTFTYQIKRGGLVGRFFFSGGISRDVQRLQGQLDYWSAHFEFFTHDA